MRPLTPFEKPIASAVVELGKLKSWEFSASLESPDGRLIEFITRMSDDGANPSSDVLSRSERSIVLHHNHLSQESLSHADWLGASTVFSEIYAHCADGTMYYGKVIDICKLTKLLPSYGLIEAAAQTALYNTLINNSFSDSCADALSSFFRKEVINQAMDKNNIVTYAVKWGNNGSALPYTRPSTPPITFSAGTGSKTICTYIGQAAKLLDLSVTTR